MPLGDQNMSIDIWNGVIEKCEKRLVNWISQYLFLGGRLTLINSVLDSMPTFYDVPLPYPWCCHWEIGCSKKKFFSGKGTVKPRSSTWWNGMHWLEVNKKGVWGSGTYKLRTNVLWWNASGDLLLGSQLSGKKLSSWSMKWQIIGPPEWSLILMESTFGDPSETCGRSLEKIAA